MAKIALLVTVTLTTRVVVEDNATDEMIAEASKRGLRAKILNDEIVENMDAINDTECPYGSIEPIDYRSGDVHEFLLDCDLITTDGMERVIEKCAELIEANSSDEVEVMVDKTYATINVVSYNIFNEKKIKETIVYALKDINNL
jgi:hypothetical protein